MKNRIAILVKKQDKHLIKALARQGIGIVVIDDVSSSLRDLVAKLKEAENMEKKKHRGKRALAKIRKPLPPQKGGPQGTPKGGRGYDRNRQKGFYRRYGG